jgi:hypothetical protein
MATIPISDYNPLIIGSTPGELADASARAQAFRTLSAQQRADLALGAADLAVRREAQLAPWERGATGGQRLSAEVDRERIAAIERQAAMPYSQLTKAQELEADLRRRQILAQILMLYAQQRTVTPEMRQQINALNNDYMNSVNQTLNTFREQAMKGLMAGPVPDDIMRKYYGEWSPRYFGRNQLAEPEARIEANVQLRERFADRYDTAGNLVQDGLIAGIDPMTGIPIYKPYIRPEPDERFIREAIRIISGGKPGEKVDFNLDFGRQPSAGSTVVQPQVGGPQVRADYSFGAGRVIPLPLQSTRENPIYELPPPRISPGPTNQLPQLPPQRGVNTPPAAVPQWTPPPTTPQVPPIGGTLMDTLMGRVPAYAAAETSNVPLLGADQYLTTDDAIRGLPGYRTPTYDDYFARTGERFELSPSEFEAQFGVKSSAPSTLAFEPNLTPWRERIPVLDESEIVPSPMIRSTRTAPFLDESQITPSAMLPARSETVGYPTALLPWSSQYRDLMGAPFTQTVSAPDLAAIAGVMPGLPRAMSEIVRGNLRRFPILVRERDILGVAPPASSPAFPTYRPPRTRSRIGLPRDRY